MTFAPHKLIALGAAVLLLSACEFRQEGSDDPEPAATDTPSGTPTSQTVPTSEESEGPVASIIRDDARSEETAPPVQALSVTVPFGADGNLNAASERVLQDVLDSDALGEGWQVILRGHTDSSGNDSANLRASRSRAEAVAAWLVQRGVDDERIVVIAFGEQNPIAPNARPDGSPDEAGRMRNRRVDIEIAPAPSTRPTAAASNDSA